MRKLLPLILGACALSSAAFAQPYYQPSGQGPVGPYITATDPSGNARKVIQPSVTLNDVTGVAIGTPANPLSTLPASGAISAVTIADGADVTKGAEADTPCATDAGTCTQMALMKRLLGQLGKQYQTGYAPLSANNNTANAIAQACVAAASAKHTYVTGAYFTALGATALANVKATVAGMQFDFQFPAGVTAIATPIMLHFDPPFDAGVNTSACATLPAAGAGNTSATASIIGYQQ